MFEIVIGVISGIVSGTGMGGGTILIFLLTFFLWNRATYCTSNKFDFFIPTSLIAIIVNVKNKNVNLKLGLIIAVYGILGAIVGANVSMHLDMKSLRKYFGIFLLVVSVHEIYSIIKQYKKEKIDKNKSKL